MTRTPSRTRTRTTRSTEHAAHRPLMHSVHIAPWLKIASCVSSHPCMRTCVLCLDCFLLAFLVFYLVSLFYFQPFLMSTSAPNERSISNPLCDSSLGSVVTSDYVTPLTFTLACCAGGLFDVSQVALCSVSEMVISYCCSRKF